jgi:primosomal protein N'
MTPAEGSRYCNVAVPHTRLGELTYRYAAADCPGLAPGDCVRVRLRGRRVRAVVLSLAERSPVPRTQAIEELVEPGLVPAELLRLLSWANAYYFGKWGASLGMALPRGVCGYGLRARPSPPVVRDAPPGPELRPELAAAVSRRRFGVWLSCSVKGRTRLLAGYVAAVRRHGSAIVLVPEPGLARVRAELGTMCGEAVVEYHGGQGAAMRKQVWRRLRSGERQVVVGVRAAVFSPVADLAGIVVLDEHDKSFKEERHPRYSARDMAVVRGRLAGCPVLLHDRVPSVETWHNARAGRYVLLDSPDIGFAHADVRVVDMRRHRGEILSPLLVRELGRCRVSSLGAVL